MKIAFFGYFQISSENTEGNFLYIYQFSGGRFKKEVVIDGESHLLLIRDEGHRPQEDQLEQVVILQNFIGEYFVTENWTKKKCFMEIIECVKLTPSMKLHF